MPRRKINQPQPAEDTRYSNLDEAVSESANELRAHAAPQYDGVLGTPDSWLPENFQQEFRAARNRLLDGGYTADQIRDLIAQEVRRDREALRNPTSAISYQGFLWPLTVRCDVRFLAHIRTAVRLERLEPGKGLAFLTDQSHANKVQTGERYRQAQSRKAKGRRGKLEGADKQTLDEVIGRLAKQYPDETAEGLWPHLWSKLEEFELNPDENDQSAKKQKWVYIYDFKGKRKTITFGSFENVVSQYRTGKKQLPRRKSR